MKALLSLILSTVFLLAYSGNKPGVYVAPLDTVTTLSGSFAELRRNHFHGGLDFRTGGQVNKPIIAANDGYVSYISISPRGYGKMAMIVHPDGYTTLYAHLNSFVDTIEAVVRKKQYERQMFEVDLDFAPGEIPVKKGQQFAWSGNTGSSGGPHLHYELRNTEKNTLCNPLMHNDVYKIEDKRSPIIFKVKIFSVDKKGVVNGVSSRSFTRRTLNGVKNGASKISVWGELGFSVQANDYMSGTTFTHSPRNLRLFVDGKLISKVNIDNIKVTDSRALNSFVDYEQHKRSGEFFMKFSKDKNCPLEIYDTIVNNGSVLFNEERVYDVRIEAVDDFGNMSEVSFPVVGSASEIVPDAVPDDDVIIDCQKGGYFDNGDFLALFADNALYTDFNVNYKRRSAPSERFYSDIHTIGSEYVPLHVFCDISVKIDRDTLADKRKYALVMVNSVGVITGYVDAEYVDGYMVGKTRVLGNFAVVADFNRPSIGAVHTKKLNYNPRLILKIGDGLSGIAKYNGYVDDKWVLFEYDAKTQQVVCDLSQTGIVPGRTRKFRFVLEDKCGNVSVFEKNIFF